MKEYLGIYKDTLKQLKSPQDFEALTENKIVLQGEISKSQIENDQELSEDLKLLTANNNGEVTAINDLSAGKAAQSFSKVMGNYVSGVNDLQKDAEKNIITFTNGGNIDVHQVMISMEKASTSMQLAVQLRNKILQAYQEISRMSV